MNAEERDLMMNWLGDQGADHDDDCPGDDTCSCSMKPTNDAISACCKFLHDAPARIATLEAAVAERDEAVKVLAEHMAAREKHETGPTVHTLHALNVACVTVEENPTARAALVAARAAVDAAKEKA